MRDAKRRLHVTELVVFSGSAYSKDPRLCIVECSQYPGDSCPVSVVSQTEHLLVLAPLGVFVPELAVDQKR